MLSNEIWDIYNEINSSYKNSSEDVKNGEFSQLFAEVAETDGIIKNNESFKVVGLKDNSTKCCFNCKKSEFLIMDCEMIICTFCGTENDSIIGIPKIDLLLTFNQKTKVDSLISDLMKQLHVGFSIKNNELLLGKEKLYFSQISPETIYLSTLNQDAKIINTNHSFKIAGNLNLLTKLENAGWKGMLIEVIPVFKSIKKLLQTTKKVEFKKVNSNSYEIIIPLKENKNVYHELLKFALSSTF